MREHNVETWTGLHFRAAGILTLASLVCFDAGVGATQEPGVPNDDGFLSPREHAALARSLTGREHGDPLITYPILDRLPAEDLLPAGSQLIVAGVLVFGDRCAFERLCARTPSGFVVVDGPSALADRVRVRSAASALRYVRLFTSPSTAKLMREPWWYEIVPTARVGEPFLLGFEREPQIWWSGEEGWPSGWFGILSREDWRRSQLRGPRVEEVPGGFVVTRFLFRSDHRHRATSTALEVQETVSPTGHLRRDVVDTVRLSDITLEVQFG